MHVLTLLYNICCFENVRAFVDHVCSTSFVGRANVRLRAAPIFLVVRREWGEKMGKREGWDEKGRGEEAKKYFFLLLASPQLRP